MIANQRLTFEAKPSAAQINEWRVEAIDYENDGQVYVAIFSGPKAEERAREYAAWQEANGLRWR